MKKKILILNDYSGPFGSGMGRNWMEIWNSKMKTSQKNGRLMWHLTEIAVQEGMDGDWESILYIPYILDDSAPNMTNNEESVLQRMCSSIFEHILKKGLPLGSRGNPVIDMSDTVVQYDPVNFQPIVKYTIRSLTSQEAERWSAYSKNLDIRRQLTQEGRMSH